VLDEAAMSAYVAVRVDAQLQDASLDVLEAGRSTAQT